MSSNSVAIADFVQKGFAPYGASVNDITSLKLKVVSWNILADRCLQFHPYVEYQPNERNQLLRAVLEDWVAKQVDFICVQEVDTGFIEEQVLNGTYKVLNTHWGLAPCICFKTDTWRLMGKKQVVSFDDLAHLGSDNTLELTSLGRTFRRNNYGVFAKLQHVQTLQEVIVSTTHLYWDPQLEHVKLCQCHYLLMKIKTFQEENDCTDLPIVFTGDLNAQPNSLCHTYLTRGKVPAVFTVDELEESYGDQADCLARSSVGRWLTNDLTCPFQKLQSAYAKSLSSSPKEECYPFTNVTDKFSGFLDYIFFQPKQLHLTKIIPLPKSIDHLQESHGSRILPSHQWPSDHLAIGAEFAFRPVTLS